MYRTFKESNNPLPRDPDLVDYGINVEEEEIFQHNNHPTKDQKGSAAQKKVDEGDATM